MAGIHYLDCDLQLERADQGYRVKMSGPSGEVSGPFSLPFSDIELENFLLKIGHTRRTMRRIDAPEATAAKALGTQLFDAVFTGDLRACLRSSLDEAGRQGAGLRIRLRLTNTPELADLPWEYLYHSANNRFLSLSTGTPLVRYLELPERIAPLALTPPLRMLVMIASPRSYPPLDVEREWGKLQGALSHLTQRRLVELERIPATLAGLQQRLRRSTYHIVHFIGHGGFDDRTQDGVLLLEDDEGESSRVSGQDLGTLLHDHRTLRLVMLNACEGARGSRSDPFAGTAQSLVQQGIPAVIAMQFEVSDEAAITLAREFYSAVADSYPVDAALTEARKALFASGNRVEWGTPVLYLRAPDGKIFAVAPTAPRPEPPAAVPPDATMAADPAPSPQSSATPAPEQTDHVGVLLAAAEPTPSGSAPAALGAVAPARPTPSAAPAAPGATSPARPTPSGSVPAASRAAAVARLTPSAAPAIHRLSYQAAPVPSRSARGQIWFWAALMVGLICEILLGSKVSGLTWLLLSGLLLGAQWAALVWSGAASPRREWPWMLLSALTIGVGGIVGLYAFGAHLLLFLMASLITCTFQLRSLRHRRPAFPLASPNSALGRQQGARFWVVWALGSAVGILSGLGVGQLVNSFSTSLLFPWMAGVLALLSTQGTALLLFVPLFRGRWLWWLISSAVITFGLLPLAMSEPQFTALAIGFFLSLLALLVAPILIWLRRPRSEITDANQLR
jgi:hypothetical protein